MKFNENPKLEHVARELSEIELRDIFESIIKKTLVSELNTIMSDKTPVNDSTMDQLVTMYKTFVDAKLDMTFILTDTYKTSREQFFEKMKSVGQGGSHRKLWNQQILKFIKNYKLECTEGLRIQLGLNEDVEVEKVVASEKYDGRYGDGKSHMDHLGKLYE